MKHFYLSILLLFFMGSLGYAQTLLPGLQMDEIDGQTIYTCDAEFFDSGGHYVDC